MTIPLDDQIAEVAREVAMRRNVYRKWVAAGKMKQADSDKQIERMEAALRTLEWLRVNKVEVLTAKALPTQAEIEEMAQWAREATDPRYSHGLHIPLGQVADMLEALGKAVAPSCKIPSSFPTFI